MARIGMSSLPPELTGQTRKVFSEPYEALFRLAPDIVLFLTPDGDIIDANQAAVKAYQYERDELIGRNIVELRAVDTVQLVPEQLQLAAVEGLIFETRHRRKDGSVFPVEVHSIGAMIGDRPALVSVIRDVTARKQAEEERERLNRRIHELARVAERRAMELDAMFDALTDAVLIHDEEAVVIRANPAAIATYGFNPVGIRRNELLERLYVRHPDGERLAPREIPSSRALAGETINNQRLSFRRADGTDLTIIVSASPLVIEGKIAGAVTVWRDVTEQERLHIALEESARLSEALIRLNEVVNSTIEEEEIIRAVLDAAGEAVDADETLLALRRDHGWQVQAQPGDARPDMSDIEAARWFWSLSRLVRGDRRPALIEDVQTDPRLDSEACRRLGIRSVLAVPLTVAGRLEGLLCFHRREQPLGFSQPEREFAENVGTSLSQTLERARLYKSQREIAATLQESLLTIPRKVPGLEVGRAYHSATGAARVGGDFYSVFRHEGRTALAIGDVSGKGVEAASLASLANNALKAYAYQESSPARIISLMNRMLYREMGGRFFVTLCLAFIDSQSGELTYSCAGHPPPILRRGPSTELLHTGAPTVGTFPEADYSDERTALSPGDLLVLYTDGVTESRRRGELFGEKRLCKLVRHASGSAEDVAQAVLDGVKAFAGGQLRDDAAVLAARLTAPEDYE
ncbi:MAG: SpoIIE family protein phosphatase [Thermoleophilia bacterium]